MSKTIKVEDQVYEDLDQLRSKGVTFSWVIADLLAGRLKVFDLLSVLESQLRFREWQQGQIDAMTKARAEQGDLEARTLTQ